MGMTWTESQKKVIDRRERNILVSAAAGSGKTAVLVERIIQKITQDKVDIDKLLIVTFTNAAAAEMRERIRDAIEKKLEEEPEDTHLQRQFTLVHNAQITTIDSFCLYVIRNWASCWKHIMRRGKKRFFLLWQGTEVPKAIRRSRI